MHTQILLVAMMIASPMVSAENNTASEATPIPPAQEVQKTTSPKAGLSFFSPKTEQDIADMATLNEPDAPADLSDE